MSKNSSKQLYESSQEWLKWARTKYPSFKLKKKKISFPPHYDFDESGRSK